jgi:hypothetical protein
MSKTGSLTETERCPKPLVCYENRCKGYIPNPLAKVREHQTEFIQTGICTVVSSICVLIRGYLGLIIFTEAS